MLHFTYFTVFCVDFILYFHNPNPSATNFHWTVSICFWITVLRHRALITYPRRSGTTSSSPGKFVNVKPYLGNSKRSVWWPPSPADAPQMLCEPEGRTHHQRRGQELPLQLWGVPLRGAPRPGEVQHLPPLYAPAVWAHQVSGTDRREFKGVYLFTMTSFSLLLLRELVFTGVQDKRTLQ